MRTSMRNHPGRPFARSQITGTEHIVYCRVSRSYGGVIPLLVQATAGGTRVLATGFSLQAVGPVSQADLQHISNLQDLIDTAGDQAYSKYGDSVAARVAVLSALRQEVPSGPGLTGQPVGLSPGGSEICIRSDSGIPVIYVIGDLDTSDLTGAAAQSANVQERSTQFLPPSKTQAVKPADQPQECGDFARQIVANNQVLEWDPGSIFFRGADSAPQIAAVLLNSKCPSFNVIPAAGSAASYTSVSEFPKYGTIIMSSHGGIDANGRFGIMSGTLWPSSNDQNYIGKPEQNLQLGTECLRELPAPHCYLTMYSNYSLWAVAPNSIVMGASVMGSAGSFRESSRPLVFLAWVPLMCPNRRIRHSRQFWHPTQMSFIGFTTSIREGEIQADGIAFFNSLLNNYSNAAEAVDSTGDPLASIGDNGQNLAYVGNPHWPSRPWLQSAPACRSWPPHSTEPKVADSPIPTT